MAADGTRFTATRFTIATPTFTGITGATGLVWREGTAVSEDTARQGALARRVARAALARAHSVDMNAAAIRAAIRLADVPAWAADSVEAAEDSMAAVGILAADDADPPLT